MNIRYDLVSSIDRFMLLESSIKDKLSTLYKYHHWFEEIFQIKLLQKVFDVKEICANEEYEKKTNSLNDEKIKEHLIDCIKSLNVIFITEYKGIEIIVKCDLEPISNRYRTLCFESWLSNENEKAQYNYVLNFTIKNTKYNGSISIDMPKDDQLINHNLIEENIRQIKKHLDIALDKFKSYEYNKEILENM